MQEILETMTQTCGWDCFIRAFDGWSLSISSGTSSESMQPLAVFRGVCYLACPMEFSHATFRLASQAEREAVMECVHLDNDEYVVAIEAETTGDLNRHLFFVVAQDVELAQSRAPHA